MTWMKSPKVLITGALLVAFAAGAAIEGLNKFGVTKASSPEPAAVTTTGYPAPTAAPAARQSGSSRVTSVSTEPQTVHHKRSWEKEALIIGGSSAAGAAIGGIAGGGKGAGIGALSGAAAGTIYDVATRNK